MINKIMSDELISAIYRKLQVLKNYSEFQNIDINKYSSSKAGERCVILNKRPEWRTVVQHNLIWLVYYVPHISTGEETILNYPKCFLFENKVNELFESGIEIPDHVIHDITNVHVSAPSVNPESPLELVYVLGYTIISR